MTGGETGEERKGEKEKMMRAAGARLVFFLSPIPPMVGGKLRDRRGKQKKERRGRLAFSLYDGKMGVE